MKIPPIVKPEKLLQRVSPAIRFNETGRSFTHQICFYIIKENRTYDQVLGDMPEGNGDTSLVLFGKISRPINISSQRLCIINNFYVDGEVSADGHNWSMGGIANDYLEKKIGW